MLPIVQSYLDAVPFFKVIEEAIELIISNKTNGLDNPRAWELFLRQPTTFDEDSLISLCKPCFNNSSFSMYNFNLLNLLCYFDLSEHIRILQKKIPSQLLRDMYNMTARMLLARSENVDMYKWSLELIKELREEADWTQQETFILVDALQKDGKKNPFFLEQMLDWFSAKQICDALRQSYHIPLKNLNLSIAKICDMNKTELIEVWRHLLNVSFYKENGEFLEAVIKEIHGIGEFELLIKQDKKCQECLRRAFEKFHTMDSTMPETARLLNISDNKKRPAENQLPSEKVKKARISTLFDSKESLEDTFMEDEGKKLATATAMDIDEDYPQHSWNNSCG